MAEVVHLDKEKLGTFSTSITVTSNNNWEISLESGGAVWYHWSNQMEKKKAHVPYLAEKTC